jgi:hypothetical protein
MHCREYMGNGAIFLHNENRIEKHKPMYRLALQANQVRHVLPQLMDLIFGKKRQAELVLQYLDLCPSGPNNSHLFDDFVEILSELRSLNMRGSGSVSRDDIRAKLVAIKEARSDR